MFWKFCFFQKIESGVVFFTGVLIFLEATAGFLATWHHVCWKRCGKRMHNDPTQDGFRFFSLPDDDNLGDLGNPGNPVMTPPPRPLYDSILCLKNGYPDNLGFIREGVIQVYPGFRVMAWGLSGFLGAKSWISHSVREWGLSRFIPVLFFRAGTLSKFIRIFFG